MHFDKKQVPLLDLWIEKDEEGRINTTLYKKVHPEILYSELTVFIQKPWLGAFPTVNTWGSGEIAHLMSNLKWKL